jgi:hypothetical protein
MPGCMIKNGVTSLTWGSWAWDLGVGKAQVLVQVSRCNSGRSGDLVADLCKTN